MVFIVKRQKLHFAIKNESFAISLTVYLGFFFGGGVDKTVRCEKFLENNFSFDNWYFNIVCRQVVVVRLRSTDRPLVAGRATRV